MWDPIDSMSDTTLARLANLRTVCLLADGGKARLVFWPCSGQRGDSTRHRPRIQFDNLRTRTVHRSEIVAVMT